MTQLGRPARTLFELDPDGVFLNHGAFGAPPAPVRAAQERWRREVERQPDVFFRETIWTALREAADDIGGFVGAQGEGIVFTPNLTEAVAVVLDAMRFQPGDEIVMLDIAYNAVHRAVEVTGERTGAVARIIPTTRDMDNADWEGLLRAALTPRTKLVLLDHIVSPTAQLVPVERLVPIAKAAGARVFIDGAHAIGQIPLDLTALGADWYATNCHKWLCAPRGACILSAAPEVRDITRPAIVSHYYRDPFPRRFDYVGTRDVTAYLAAPEARRFIAEIGWDALNAHRLALRDYADMAIARLGGAPVTPRAPGLTAWTLPQTRPPTPEDGPALMRALWYEAGVQVAATSTAGHLLLRLSLQLYNDAADVAAVIAALERLGWPGR